MKYTAEQLERIHAKTDGRCHLCARTISLRSYGRTWENDHSKARANGGTNHLNNIYPACKACNRSKGAGSTRAYRRQNGLRRAPMSEHEQNIVRFRNTARAGFIGCLIGKVLHPNGAKLGAIAGIVLGVMIDPEN